MEESPEVQSLIEAALAEARELVERQGEESGYDARGIRMGKVNAIWKEAARILQERHGITWENPMQRTPGLRVD